MIAFTIIGFLFCRVIALIIIGMLYVWLIHPAIQAVSILRWTMACMRKATGDEIPFKTKLSIFAQSYHLGGMQCSRITNRYGEWYGVGDWQLYRSEEDEAP